MTTDPSALDDLYAAPLDEFTSRRNALAKETGAAGNKELAAEIKKLTKPSAPAWTLNQLVRSDPGGVDDLLDNAEKMRAAQRGEGGDVRALNAQVRAQVAKLLAEAEEITEAAGRNATQTLKNLVTQSLMAAAAEEAAGATLRAGRLSRELEPGGFNATDGDLVVAPREPAGAARKEEAKARAAALEEEADTAEAEAKKLAKEADRAEREATRARAKAEEAASIAQGKRAKADSAANAL